MEDEFVENKPLYVMKKPMKQSPSNRTISTLWQTKGRFSQLEVVDKKINKGDAKPKHSWGFTILYIFTSFLHKIYRIILGVIFLIPGILKMKYAYHYDNRVIKRVSYGNKGHQILDIYIPSKKPPSGKYAVLVWFQGGGYYAHDAVFGYLLGRYFLLTDVIFVAPLYGKLPHTMTEILDDVDLAIEWVFANISTFGGDVGQIYVGGQSAGAHLSLTTIFQNIQLEAQHNINPASVEKPLKWRTSKIKAIIAVAGPYNLITMSMLINEKGVDKYLQNFLLFSDVNYLTDYSPELMVQTEEFMKSNAATTVPNIHFLHGALDNIVPLTTTTNLISILNTKTTIKSSFKIWPHLAHFEAIIQGIMLGGKQIIISDILKVIQAEGKFIENNEDDVKLIGPEMKPTISLFSYRVFTYFINRL